MTATLLGFNSAAFALTLLGGFVPMRRSLFSTTSLWRLFSFRSGVLLAVAFVEILPHALERSPATAGWGALVGFSLLFAMESLAMGDSCPEYLESCSVHLIGWTALTALFGHALIDGFNLTLSFSAGALAGTAIGVAVAVHKLVDGFTLTSLLVESGYSRRASLWALTVTAAATPLGSLLALWNVEALPAGAHSALLGFAAGSFVYIGSADVLPRLHKTQDKACLALFAGGIALMLVLRGAH